MFRQARVQLLPFHVLDPLHYQTVIFPGRVAHNVQQSNNIWATGEIAQNLDFALDFFGGHRFEYLDNATVLVDVVKPLKYLEFMNEFHGPSTKERGLTLLRWNVPLNICLPLRDRRSRSVLGSSTRSESCRSRTSEAPGLHLRWRRRET